MKNIEHIIAAFTSKPYLVSQGAKKTAKYLNVSVEEVMEARVKWHSFKTSVKEAFPKKANILILDIETAPMKAYVWSRWKQNIYLEQTISEWFILTWAAKWLGEDLCYSECLTPQEALQEDDKRIVEKLWTLLDQADITITHNGRKFDLPKINTRFIVNGLPPTSPYKQIDTKEVAKRQFGFSSNKLDALAGYFGIRHKDDTNFELWAKCLEGDVDALEYMSTYNIGDVEILEQVYLKLRPWIKNHPNVALYSEQEHSCPYCGSKLISPEIKEFAYTPTCKYEIVRCGHCGAVARKTTNMLPKGIRKNILRST